MRQEDIYEMILHIEDVSIKMLKEQRKEVEEAIEDALSNKESKPEMPTAEWDTDGMRMKMCISSNVIAFCGTIERYESMVIYYTFRAWVESQTPEEYEIIFDIDEICEGLLKRSAAYGNRKKYDDFYKRWMQGKELMDVYRFLLMTSQVAN